MATALIVSLAPVAHAARGLPNDDDAYFNALQTAGMTPAHIAELGRDRLITEGQYL